MKRLFSIILVVALLLALIAGCGSNDLTSDQPTVTPLVTKTQTPDSGDNVENDDDYISKLPIVEEPVTFSYWFPWSALLAGMMTSMEENMGAQKIAEDTNVFLEYIHPAIGQEAESFNLLMASQAYTDFILIPEGNMIAYPGGVETAIEDGVYIQLNDLVDKYAPDYLVVVNRDPDKQRQTITDNGARYGFHHLTEDAEPAWTGIAVRQDWLNDLGLSAPHTIDSWEKVLTAFKEEKGATAPLMIPATGVYYSSEFLSAFGLGKDFFNVDGTVKYGPVDDAYYDYITLMADWFAKGLLDPDFTSKTDGASSVTFNIPNEIVLNGVTGAGPLVRGMLGPGYYNYGMVESPDEIYYIAVVNPVVSKGDVTRLGYVSQKVRSYTVITTECDDPVTAVKYFNYLYTEQGSMAINWGIEGASYTMVDGKPKFTENMFDYTTKLGTGIRYFWFRGDGPGLVDYNRMYHAGNMTEFKISLTWGENNTDYNMPVTSFTADEGNRYSNLMADINIFVQEKTVGFITGSTALTKEAFEEFKSQIKSMGIDKAIEIQQDALSRYLNR